MSVWVCVWGGGGGVGREVGLVSVSSVLHCHFPYILSQFPC